MDTSGASPTSSFQGQYTTSPAAGNSGGWELTTAPFSRELLLA